MGIMLGLCTVVVWLLAAMAIKMAMRHSGQEPLKFWQFTLRQLIVLIAVAAVLAWIANRIYIDRFAPI